MKRFLSAVAASLILILNTTALAQTATSPSMMYNGRVLTSDTYKPVIVNDRTMLPFRFFLEEIGAEVNYIEETRMVNATKDGISIAFSLDDKYIDITKNNNTYRTIQDVDNFIKDDRVYVPIRFMSEAFDLDVGWDQENRTAIVADFRKYLNEELKNYPNLKKIGEVSTLNGKSYMQSADFAVKYKNYNEDAYNNFIFDIYSDFILKDGKASLDAVMGMNVYEDDKNLSMSPMGIQNIQFSFAYDDDILYIKTNLFDKLKELGLATENMENMSSLIDKNTWFAADINELFAELGLDASDIQLVRGSIEKGNTINDLLLEFTKAVCTEYLASAEKAKELDTVVLALIEGYNELIVVTDKGEGDWELKLDLSQILNDGQTGNNKFSIWYNIQDNMEKDMKAELVISDEETQSEVSIVFDKTMTLDVKDDIYLPESAIDLINIIKLFQ